jgi:hypothetical protein
VAVTGEWTRKLDAAADSVRGHVLYIRWVSKSATPGDDCIIDVKEEEGGDSVITFVANGGRFVDVAWVDRKCTIEINTIDSGFLEVYLTRG